jgi:hypothetical protein
LHGSIPERATRPVQVRDASEEDPERDQSEPEDVDVMAASWCGGWPSREELASTAAGRLLRSRRDALR